MEAFRATIRCQEVNGPRSPKLRVSKILKVHFQLLYQESSGGGDDSFRIEVSTLERLTRRIGRDRKECTEVSANTDEVSEDCHLIRIKEVSFVILSNVVS